MTPDGKEIKEQHQWEARAQWRGPALTDDAKLHVRFYFATRRRRDPDNINKLILDALMRLPWHPDFTSFNPGYAAVQSGDLISKELPGSKFAAANHAHSVFAIQSAVSGLNL